MGTVRGPCATETACFLATSLTGGRTRNRISRKREPNAEMPGRGFKGQETESDIDRERNTGIQTDTLTEGKKDR